MSSRLQSSNVHRHTVDQVGRRSPSSKSAVARCLYVATAASTRGPGNIQSSPVSPRFRKEMVKGNIVEDETRRKLTAIDGNNRQLVAGSRRAEVS